MLASLPDHAAAAHANLAAPDRLRPSARGVTDVSDRPGTETLLLPREFELLTVPSASDVLDCGVEQARRGADEGTLVWLLEQTHGRTRNGERWHAGPDDLHCALVLHPEFDRATSLQLAFVAALSLGAVLAEQVQPMTTLHYRWPDQVLLRHGKVAQLRLAGARAGEGFEWLVLALDVNVGPLSGEHEFAGSAVQTDGQCEATRELLLEDFCRYFLRTINEWAQRGFAPLLQAWRQRCAQLGEYRLVSLERGEVEGTLEEIDDDGAAVFASAGGAMRITLEAYFRAVLGTP